jgi:hypothetical protein
MADLYLDENVSARLISPLMARGHDVLHGRAVHPAKTDDHVHFASATRLNRILITHDIKDFRLLHRAWRDWFAEWGVPPHPEHAAILQAPQPPQVSVAVLVELLDDFVRQAGTDSALLNRLFSWSAPRGWEEIR